MIAEPSSSRRTFAAASVCPRSGRNAWIRGRNDARERLEARQALTVDEGLTLADERQRQVRKRSEIAGRADGASARDDREHAALEALEQQLDGLDAGARVSLGERVRPEEHGGPYDFVGIRLADTACV